MVRHQARTSKSFKSVIEVCRTNALDSWCLKARTIIRNRPPSIPHTSFQRPPVPTLGVSFDPTLDMPVYLRLQLLRCPAKIVYPAATLSPTTLLSSDKKRTLYAIKTPTSLHQHTPTHPPTHPPLLLSCCACTKPTKQLTTSEHPTAPAYTIVPAILQYAHRKQKKNTETTPYLNKRSAS